MAKIRLTEAQFKSYCRKLLNEKRSEDYAKEILKEGFKPVFQPLKQPLMAFKLIKERYLNSFINNGFSNKFLGRNLNVYGDGFYFVINKNTFKRLPIEYFGNIMLTVEILPGAKVFHYSYLEENDAIVVSPEDGSKIKIVKAEDINTGKILYGKENNSNIYGDNWTSTIAEQKLEKIIAESVKKVLQNEDFDWEKWDSKTPEEQEKEKERIISANNRYINRGGKRAYKKVDDGKGNKLPWKVNSQKWLWTNHRLGDNWSPEESEVFNDLDKMPLQKAIAESIKKALSDKNNIVPQE